MTNTYNTGNSLGSTDPRDLYDNASNFDEGMNRSGPTFTDRLGNLRKTWNGMETEFDLDQAGRVAEFQAFLVASGYVSLGNYAAGLNFTAYNQYMARDGFFYRPAPSSVPFTTTGTWAGGDEALFVLMSEDAVLRQDLLNTADPSKNSELVGFKAFADTLATTVSAKCRTALDLVVDFGADPTGSTDNAALIQGALDTAAANGRMLYVPAGEYLVEAYADGSVIRPPNGTHLVCHSESWFKLNNSGGFNLTAFFEHNTRERLTYVDLGLDAGLIPGANVFGANNSHTVELVRPRVKNGRRNPAGTLSGGGRGITFQLNCRDIHISHPWVDNCTSGIDFHGAQPDGPTEKRVFNVVVSSPIVSRCEEAFSFYDLADGNLSPSTGGDVQVYIADAAVYNCGRATNETVPGGAAVGTEGGVIVCERARSWAINGLTVYNEASYGKIGGIFRGTGANFYLRGVVAYANVVAPINVSPAANLLPLAAGVTVQTVSPSVDGLDLRGTCDYGVFHDAGSGTNQLYRASFRNVSIPVPAVSLVNSVIGLRGGSFFEFADASSGARVIGFSNALQLDANAFTANTLVQAAAISQRAGLDISVLNQFKQLRVERRGSSAGVGRIWASDQGLSLGSDALSAKLVVDTVGAAGDVKIPTHSFSAGRLVFGAYYLWVDSSGRLRIKNGAPTSDTDGVIVGTQV